MYGNLQQQKKTISVTNKFHTYTHAYLNGEKEMKTTNEFYT